MIKLIFFCFIISNLLSSRSSAFETLDISFDNYLPFINIEVEGKSYKCLLDTGNRSDQLVLNEEILLNLKTIKPFSRKIKISNAAGIEYIAKKYILPKFNIGKIIFNKVTLSENTHWGVKSSNTPNNSKDGVVGMALFEGKSIIIDYPNSKLVISDNGELPGDYKIKNWNNLDYKLDLNGISIYAYVDSQLKRFILDSGANLSIIKPSSLNLTICKNKKMDDNQCIHQVNNLKVQNTPNSHPFSLYLYEMNGYKIDGLLGYNFLINHIIYIDFNQKIIKIQQIYN
jgi:hypothetical protein